ncbi:hypothetical protein CkaCkLH20_04555 [Colletotrichum karsti]|uniref:Uncharacterized protein n=1 Tax=Colletotrichum karsti TaxID=1095194 RepID=A0A9P6LJ46_9PEZI|nr:uncharacterized protein CkaCkLH20_04555 [Colletotrichum karsti]KAF9877979.1 hypothetical protein CkaCkLH20_04555 [Colletotrichum karsti]
MSSNESSPYTIPYTGAPGQQVAGVIVPASSKETGPAAHPAAPQDQKDQASFQRPVVAEEPSAPNMDHSKGESMMMSGANGMGVTSDSNSASRRSSVVPTTSTGPSDRIPGRFASASAGKDGIATILPEHRGSKDIHSSEKKEDKTPKAQGSQSQGTASFGLDGASDTPRVLRNPYIIPISGRLSRNDSPMLFRELQTTRFENEQLRQMLHSSNVVAYQWYCKCVNSNNQVNELKAAKDLLTSTVLSLNSKVQQMDPDMYCNLPASLKEMLEDIREEWKYDEWYKAFIDPASDDYVPQNWILDSDLEEEVHGLGISTASSHASDV